MTIVGIFTFFFMKRLNELIFECFYYRFNDCIMYMWIWWQIIAFIIMKHLSSFNLYGNRFYMLIYIIFWNTMIPYQVGKLCCSHDLRFCSNLSPFVSISSNSNKPKMMKIWDTALKIIYVSFRSVHSHKVKTSGRITLLSSDPSFLKIDIYGRIKLNRISWL